MSARTCIVIAMTILFMSSAVSGGPSTETRAQYKASLILKLLEYVSWESGGPAKGEAIVIGVIEDAPLAKKMSDVLSFSALDPKPKLRKLKADDDLSTCNVIYVSASDIAGAEAVVARLGDQKIFTISDAEGLVQSGVMVNFIQKSETGVKKKFEVNLTQVQDKGMKISSKFLKLARVYEGTAGNLVLND